MVKAMISVFYLDDEPDLLEKERLNIGRYGEFRIGIAKSAKKALNSNLIHSRDARKRARFEIIVPKRMRHFAGMIA
jgi:hypothetical protein